MGRTRLLAALAASLALGVGSAMAQAPKLLPSVDQGKVISDRVISPGASHDDHGAYTVGPAVQGDAGVAPYGGYPYSLNWHAGYQHPMYGRPVALVVPPVSHYQTIYGWGVASTQMTPIYPQYGGPGYGTPYGDVDGHYPFPPYWPSDTRQFGVYYIRGPW
jgi:hypothetical protein